MHCDNLIILYCTAIIYEIMIDAFITSEVVDIVVFSCGEMVQCSFPKDFYMQILISSVL